MFDGSGIELCPLFHDNFIVLHVCPLFHGSDIELCPLFHGNDIELCLLFHGNNIELYPMEMGKIPCYKLA